MRSASLRKEKYKKKIRGLVIPGQTDRYAPTAQDRLHLEYCVKREAITPMLQFSYVAFCEELLKHEASKRPVEAQGIYNKWLNRGLDATTLQSVASCVGVSIEIPAPPVCAWSWKRKLTFSGNVSASNLDDIPVLVHLTVANFDFNKAKNNGEDIRFMDTDTCPSDGTPLKHEIEHWDKPGANAWVWVKVPRINGGTVNDFIYMFYGNAAAPDGQDVNNTWNANYVGVWHLRGDGTTTIPESARSTHTGTKEAIGNPANITENIDGSQEFTSDYIEVADHANLTGMATVQLSCWVYFSSLAAHNYVFDKEGVNYSYMINAYADGRIRFYVKGVAAEAGATAVAGTVTTGQWYHVVGTYDGANVRIYIDDVIKKTTPLVGGNVFDSNVKLGMGARMVAVPDRRLAGKIDECRLSNIYRTTDWNTAVHKSDVETLITYGAEEAVP